MTGQTSVGGKFPNSGVDAERPTLVVMTTYFHEKDYAAAYQLGLDLYAAITRPLEDPLAYGPGIPVLCAVASNQVDTEAAGTVVVIPVLGGLTLNTMRDDAVAQIRQWHERLGKGHVLPVPLAEAWRSVEAELPGKPILTELYAEEPRRRETITELVLAISWLLSANRDETTLFVSHAKADLEPTKDAARKIADYAMTQLTARAFFDRTELFGGESLDDQIDFAASRGVFVAVRGDSYSARIWCQHELLQAKKHGLPTLTVWVVRKGEQRSLAYGGNGPTLVWNANEEDSGRVVLHAMVEWLRAQHFRREGHRIRDAAGLPAAEILVRPPELLDMAQGPLRSDAAQLVMYPDPELPVQERQILRAANPQMHLVTPLTAYRRVLSRDSHLLADAPLQGLQVGLSLSDSPDVDGPEGFTKHHVADVTVQVARALISAGAAIAYGGDFRHHDMMDPKRLGYTLLLAELIGAYNQTAADRREFLHSYLASVIPIGDVPDHVPMTLHHMVESPDMAALAVFPPTDQESHPPALHFSDMRRAMAKKTNARVVIGGNPKPRVDEGADGYGGRYPGVVEEAWWSLKEGQPLYVVGGFGGGAALVAELFAPNHVIPEDLRDATWMGYERFRSQAEAVDADPHRTVLELPESMDALAEEIRERSLEYLASDDSSVSWNGLTIKENQSLLWSRDPVRITSLVLKGMLNVSRRLAAGKIHVDLVHGSVTDARELDAIAVGVFNDVPMGGAGAALNDIVGGRAAADRARGTQLVSISHSDVDADWIHLASLGNLSSDTPIEERIRSAAASTAKVARRHGLNRLGVVAYGGTVVADVDLLARSMVDGLTDLAGISTVTWFERDERRFDILQQQLSNDPRVKLTTRRIVVPTTEIQVRPQPLILQVGYEDGHLIATVLPPSGTAVASIRRERFPESELKRLYEGLGAAKRRTPNLSELRSRGAEIARLLLGEDAAQVLAQTAETSVVVVHDVASSRLPFELLCTLTPGNTAFSEGINRRLAVPGISVEHLFARPPKSERYNLLLVINPTEDLPGAEEEGEAVRKILGQQGSRISLTILRGKEATQRALLDAFPLTDVFHYCGHAFFDGPGESESGLLLAGHKPLTLADVRGVSTPRVAFVNACEAGRVRGDVTTPAASFAEFFLRSGVEAYLGTFWTVDDRAAQLFATTVYTQLGTGKTLDESVTQGRRELEAESLPDYLNYILYGDGRFRLVDPDNRTDSR